MLDSAWMCDANGGVQTIIKVININAKSITVKNGAAFNVTPSGVWAGTTQNITIYKVLGYK